MVTVDATTGMGTIVRFPTRTELRAMMDRTSVAVTAIIAATVVVLAFVAALVYMVREGLPTEALTLAVIGPLIGILVSISSRVKETARKVDQLQSTQDGQS